MWIILSTATGRAWLRLSGLGPGLHYGGPFFIGCDHGCYHGGGSHGVGRGKETYCIGAGPSEYEIVVNSHASIAVANVVFAWIDNPTAYGSFAELGIAYAMRKPIWLAWPKRLPDLWFIEQMASVAVIAQTPQLAFRELLFTHWHRSLF